MNSQFCQSHWFKLFLFSASLLLAPVKSKAQVSPTFNFSSPGLIVDGRWEALATGRNTARLRPWLLSPNPGHAEISRIAHDFLWTNALAIGLESADDISAREYIELNNVTTVRLHRSSEVLVGTHTQRVPMRGGEALVHFQGGRLLYASSASGSAPRRSLRFTLPIADAQALAAATSGFRAPAILHSGLVVLNRAERQSVRPAYEVKVGSSDDFLISTIYIDAENGSLLQEMSAVHHHNHLEHRHSRIVLEGSASFRDRDRILQLMQSRGPVENEFPRLLSTDPCPGCTNPSDSRAGEAANFAFRNTGIVLDYFSRHFGQNSFDNRGTPLRALVRFLDSWPNAAWIDELNLIVFGEGDPLRFHSFARALDVTAHEVMHAVTTRTSNLQYSSESGALNESYSDVFARLIANEAEAQDSWRIGYAVFKDGVRFIRDMENPEVPHVRNQRFKGEVCERRNDSCGVHVNAGIPNRAAVLAAKAIGSEDLRKIYYRTLTQLLRTTSNFRDARAQTLAACALELGADSPKCPLLAQAFEAVGITEN